MIAGKGGRRGACRGRTWQTWFDSRHTCRLNLALQGDNTSLDGWIDTRQPTSSDTLRSASYYRVRHTPISRTLAKTPAQLGLPCPQACRLLPSPRQRFSPMHPTYSNYPTRPYSAPGLGAPKKASRISASGYLVKSLAQLPGRHLRRYLLTPTAAARTRCFSEHPRRETSGSSTPLKMRATKMGPS